MRFYLGTHEVSWLGRTDVPLFISHRRLAHRKSFPEALGPWALDSGGFTELNAAGRWETTPATYVANVRRFQDHIGGMAWAAPQDWMCEPAVVAKTGLSVPRHQSNTVANLIHLRSIAPDLPFIPVLQGWELSDYLRCIDMYAVVGIDLTTEPLVGIGSVCRRQSTTEIAQIAGTIAGLGIRLHGFGVKTIGLGAYGEDLTSADSLAWSYRARNSRPMRGCTHGSCSSCLRFALKWRENVLRASAVQRLPYVLRPTAALGGQR